MSMSGVAVSEVRGKRGTVDVLLFFRVIDFLSVSRRRIVELFEGYSGTYERTRK